MSDTTTAQPLEILDVHEAAIVTILQRVMDIIDPTALPEPPKKETCPALRGRFQVKEGKARYVTAVPRKTRKQG